MHTHRHMCNLLCPLLLRAPTEKMMVAASSLAGSWIRDLHSLKTITGPAKEVCTPKRVFSSGDPLMIKSIRVSRTVERKE